MSTEATNGLVFDRMLFDASGADYAVESYDGNAIGPFGKTLYRSCVFTGAKKAGFGMTPHNDERPNSVLLSDCTFTGNEFWLESGIGPKATIEVQDSTHGHVFLRSAGGAGTTTARWNAVVTSS